MTVNAKKCQRSWVNANLLSLSIYVLLALSSQFSVFLRLCIMNTFAFSVMSVIPQSQERTLGWSAYPFPRLDQNVLSRLAEYNDYMRGPLFSAFPRTPQPLVHQCH